MFTFSTSWKNARMPRRFA